MPNGGIAADLAPLARDITTLHPMPGNPRKGDVAAVARSYRQFGQRKPVVARRDGLGDLWLLGPHRVLCGDSTDPATYVTVLDGEPADMVWTDPPYGVDVAGGSHDVRSKRHRSGGTIENDALPPDYHYRHETLFFGWVPGAGHHAPKERNLDSVWEVDRGQKSMEHPTMKPVELVARAIGNHTDEQELVLDPFGGSGSTLIAAHGLERRAALIELDPRYVDVICRRYQRHTGDLPVLASTGLPVDFEAAL